MSWRTVGLVFVSLFFVLFLNLTIVGIGAQVLLHPTIYENALVKADVYSMIEDEVAKGPLPIEAVAPDGLEPLVGKILKNSLAYMRGDTDSLDLVIGVDPTYFERFLLDQVEAVPECNGQDPFIGDEVVCRPAYLSTEEFFEEVKQRQGIDLARFESVDLEEVYFQNGMIHEVRRFVSQLETGIYIVVGLALCCMLIIVGLTRKDLKRMFGWLGTPLLLVGLGWLTITLVGIYLLPDYLPIDIEPLRIFLIELMTSFLSSVLFFAVAMVGLGAALIIFALVKRTTGSGAQKKKR